MNRFTKLIFISALLLSCFAQAEMGVPIQLRLKSPGGAYPTESGLSIKVLILSASTSCILREENFSAQTINNGNLSLNLGSGARGSNDPSLTLNQVYDNSKAKTGLSCVDANSNIISTGQTYTPAAGDQRVIRIATTVSSDPIIVNFNMRSTPYAIQAESVGGKSAAEIIVNNASSQMNQTNLNDLLLDVTRFNNLKNIAVSGQADSSVNFTGGLAGDVSGTQGATSVNKIKGVAVSATAPSNGDVLQYNGAQYVPVAIPSAPVSSVAGRTGAVVLSNTDISGLGGAATLNVGTTAGTVAAGNDTRLVNALQSSSSLSGDVGGTVSATVVNSVGGKSAAQISSAVADVAAATSSNTVSTLVKRDGSGNISAATVSSTNNSTQNIYLYENTNTNHVHLKAPASFSDYTLTLPVDDGANGQILQTDGSGNLAWVNAGGGGSVNSVTAAAPLASSGGVNPNITLSQSNAGTDGFLSSADWNTFNSKQNSLGFSPLNPANNLSDVASVATARTNLGLGGAATLNVGTAAGTVAAGDDARINGALQSSAFNAAIASANCTSSESMYWNSVSSEFLCQAISFPADAVSSVAGRTGAVVLSNTDISGLGGAATLNVGTAAGTVAAGNDSRMVNAVQTSSSLSGDASGTISTISVNKIKGVAVSGTAPSNGDVLQYNGSQYVPVAIPSAPVSSVAGRTGAVVLTPADISVPTCGGGEYLTYNGSAWSCVADQDSNSGGTVTAVTASAPLASSGGNTPNITLSQANTSTNGYLSSADWNTFNSKQNSLGFSPLNPANNLSDVASVATARTNLGLGGSATLNVGSSAGTVAAGDDSRIANAVQTSSSLSGDASGTISTISVNKIKGVAVSGTAPSNGDVLQYNGSQYVPVAIPSAPVSSVAGRTGAVVLSNTDISGLGGAALLNVGTTAGSVAAGDDSRIANAVQTSSAHSGDVSGTLTNLSVNKIKGVAVSGTAPSNGDVLQYNGSQYVPVAIPSAPVSSVAGRTGAVVLSNTDISGLGGAATLNVGSSAGTVAAGNDARITGALNSSTVASASCTTSETLYWNSVSSQFLCQAISFPANAVTSVAGRTGAVVLSSSDISGLGGAAGLNVGTTAGTVAAGNDSRMVNAVQTSSSLSGDASGTISTISVNKIKGVAVSATAPSNGDVLQYNGSQYVPTAIPSAPVSSVAGRTGAVVLSNTDISGLGGAALLNVGTVAGTVAAGNDARFTDSRAPSGTAGGDLSGTYPNPVLANVVTAGTSSKVTFDAKGRITSSAALNSGDITSALTFVPLKPANNLSDVASVATARTNLGLGGAATLNVGTSAGTVAAGNDARITGALNSSTVASASCSTSETLYWNSVSSQFLCQAISFPADAVSSVAGRTGAVVLSNADVSGLGGAAILNVGTSAGTVAAGNDSRMVNAVQTSSALSGDASGTISTISVNKIKGVAVSATAPTNNQVLQYNGAQYVPVTLPSAPVSSVAGRTGAVVLSNTDISGLGGAALLNVGTVAGTVAAGNDARFTDSRAPSGTAGGDLSGTYPNPVLANVVTAGTSSKVTFDAKGRITSSAALNSSDITSALTFVPLKPANNLSDLASAATARTNLGLGGAATLNVGTSAGTVAAGDDSRIANALQTSSVHSGDVSGTASTMSVNKIRGVAVSGAAPANGDVLQYNGSQYVPTAIPSAPVSSVAGRTGAVVLSNTDISGLGGAALLNVGTVAGTVAAGNDARFTDSRAPSGTASGDLSGTYPNPVLANVVTAGTSSKVTFDAKGRIISSAALNSGDITSALTFVPLKPANNLSDVASVATARTNLGLGGAATLNVGTSAGTVAAGDDSRLVNAVQTSSALSGDASGTISSISVNKIKGIAVSATAPTNNQVLQYNGTQYVPVNLPSALVSSVAGRTGAVVLSNTDISGLGGAALLNVGTAAGTVAAGNDARITGALAASAFNGYVASSSCTTSQTLYWNSVSSQFLCQAISFPADAVSSVAGRTGAVVLASSDISGLGSAAGLNVGVVANNVVQLDAGARIPASTLPANALTTSSAYSGDVSGTSSTMSVDSIKGRAISSTAPVAGQALVYNGSQWVPTTGFPSFARKTGDQTFSSSTVANVTELSFPVASGVVYKYKFMIMYTSASTGTGLRVGLTYPAVTNATALANIASGNDGGGAYFQGVINSSGDSVTATATPTTAPKVQLAIVEGIIVPSAAGTVQLTAASETGTSNIIIKTGSFAEIVVVP